MNACLKRFSAIEINTEGLLSYKVENKSCIRCVWRLKPRFDIFRDAERIEHAAAVGLNLE
jgi:hypothetical protein